MPRQPGSAGSHFTPKYEHLVRLSPFLSLLLTSLSLSWVAEGWIFSVGYILSIQSSGEVTIFWVIGTLLRELILLP